MHAKIKRVPFYIFECEILENHVKVGLPRLLSWYRNHLQCGRPWFHSQVGKIPWRRDRLPTPLFLGFPDAQAVKNPPAMRETWVGKISWGRAWQPTPVFLPGESPWTEQPGGLQSTRSQRSRHDWATQHSPAHGKVNLFICRERKLLLCWYSEHITICGAVPHCPSYQ